MENLKFVIIDSDPSRRDETRRAVEEAGHIVVREAGTLEEYQETMQKFYQGELEANFFLCNRSEIKPRQSRKMWAIGAYTLRIGERADLLEADVLPENRTIESVLAEIAELKEL